MFNPNQRYIVTQANNLIEARHSSTLQEIRLVLTMIAMVEPNDEDFKEYEIKVSDFFNLIGLKYKSTYEVMEMTLDKLMKRVIHIPQQDGFLKVHWVSSARYHTGKGVISIKFDPELKPFLLNLKGQFTQQQLQILLSFSSIYSTRIYQILKKNENIGKVRFEINDFREILGIEEHKYTAYKDLKRWVIYHAKKEFETKNKETGAYKSDISFDLETERKNRKIKYLTFHIKKQAYQDTLPLEGERFELEPEIVKRLQDYGISRKDAMAFLQEQGEMQVIACVDLYELRVKKGLVKESSSGYLAKMLRDKAGEKAPQELEQAEKEAHKKQVKLAQEAFAQIEERVYQLRREQASEIIAALSSEDIDLYQQEFLSLPENNVFKLEEKRKGWESAGIKMAFQAFLLRKLIRKTGEEDYRQIAQEMGYDYATLQQDIANGSMNRK